MADKKNIKDSKFGFDIPADPEEKARVGRIEAEALSFKNILATRLKIVTAAKEEANFAKEITKLGQEGRKNANEYLDISKRIANTEKEIQRRRALGTAAGDRSAKNTERQLRTEKADQEKLLRTAGGYFKAQEQAALKKKESLLVERRLLKDINNERGLGIKLFGKSFTLPTDVLKDAFKSKKGQQQAIDSARARVSGGVNPAAGGGGAGGGGSDNLTAALGGAGPIGATVAGAIKIAEAIKAPFKAAGRLIMDNITQPFKEAAALVGGGVGIGGGAVSGAGATSLLSGVSNVAKTIPLIGDKLAGVIDLFKGILDFALGIDAANTRIARSLGISKTQAIALKKDFIAIEQASTSIVVNQTRLVESQIELSQQLGVQNTLSGDILATNIELKEVAGIEVETRKQIAQASIITGRNAKQLTQSVLGQVAAFEGLTGIAFNFRDILGEAAKQTGVLGLQFAKFPENLTKALVTVKALGFSLKQVNDIAGGLVDFESSISKEFEAQVLLGRNINLTKAREAALNNDLVTVAAEITKNVGSAGQFLKLNRIQQDAIAQSVGMTRDSLADTLKQQEAFTKLGAKDIKQANEKIALLKQQGKSQEEISKMLGEDAYNYITQTGTAEKLAEIMNKIKIAFVEFVEKSGIIEFLSNPARLEGFVKGMVSRIAGAVEVIGDIIGGILDFIGTLPGTDKLKYQTLASNVRSGAGELGGGIRATAANIDFGAGNESISGTVEGGTKKNGSMGSNKASTNTPAPIFNVQNTVMVGTEKWDSQTRSSLEESPGTWAQ